MNHDQEHIKTYSDKSAQTHAWSRLICRNMWGRTCWIRSWRWWSCNRSTSIIFTIPLTSAGSCTILSTGNWWTILKITWTTLKYGFKRVSGTSAYIDCEAFWWSIWTVPHSWCDWRICWRWCGRRCWLLKWRKIKKEYRNCKSDVRYYVRRKHEFKMKNNTTI